MVELTQDPMVSAEWLSVNLSNPNVIAMDATWCMPGKEEPYPEIFIDGVKIDIDVVADQSSKHAHMLPSPEEFETHMRKMGINVDSMIICYDKHGLQGAPRTWWMLRAMGHDNVRVLNGGLPAWIDAGHSTVFKLFERKEGNFRASFKPDLVRSMDDIHAALGQCQILDARSAGRFAGTAPEPRVGLSSGHMPGATSTPFGLLKTKSGFLKSKEELLDIFKGVNPNKPIITTCGSGITACGIALALARLGVWDAAVYDGSWVEWASTPDSPIEKAG